MPDRPNRSNQASPRKRKSSARGGGGANVSKPLRRSGLRGQEGAGYSDEPDPLLEEQYSGRDRHPHRASYEEDEGLQASADIHSLGNYRARLRKSRHGEDFKIYEEETDFEDEEDLIEGYEVQESDDPKVGEREY